MSDMSLTEYKKTVDHLFNNYDSLDRATRTRYIKKAKMLRHGIDNKNISKEHDKKLDTIANIHRLEQDQKVINNIDLITLITIFFYPTLIITNWYSMNFASMGQDVNKGWKGVKGTYIKDEPIWTALIPSVVIGVVFVFTYTDVRKYFR